MTAWCSASRSNSASPPPSLAATSHACGAGPSPRPPGGVAHDRQRQRAAVQLAAGRVAAARAGAGALAQLVGGRGEPSAAAARAPSRRASTSPRASKIDRGAADQRRERAGDAVEPLLGQHDPLEPLVGGERPLEHRVLLVDQVRERLLGDRDERHLVRDLEQREAELGRPPRAAPSGASACANPMPRPSPASSWPASRSTNARCSSARLRFIPVVSSSSPPDSHGVGSASSEMWTQRTGLSSPPRRRRAGRRGRG